MTANVILGLRYFFFTCAAVAVVENLLVLTVLAGTANFRVKYYGFVFNLAMADLYFGACAMAVGWKIGANVLFALMLSGFLVSVLTILAEAVNRLLALSLPQARYHELVTPCRTAAVCIILWCFALFVYVFPLLVASDELTYYLLMKGLLSPLGVLLVWLIGVVLYFITFRKIKQFTSPFASSPGINASMEHVQPDSRLSQTRRLLITFVFILVSSFVCWMPYVVVEILFYFNVIKLFDVSFEVSYWAVLSIYCFFTIINPMIYWGRLDGFREAFYALFCRCLVKRQSKKKGAERTDDQTEVDTMI